MKTPFTIKLLYWISNIFTGFAGVMILIILVLNVLILTGTGIDNWIFTMKLPVEVGGDQGTYFSGETEHPALLTEAVGKIAIEGAPKTMMLYGTLALLFFMFIGFIFSWVFMKLMRNVRKGEVFNLQNMKYLRHMSYLIMFFWFVRLIYYKSLYYLYVGNIQFDHLVFNKDFDYQFLILVPALFLGVLAHIFTKGFELQEESKLTV